MDYIRALIVNFTRFNNPFTFSLVTRAHKNSNWVISFFLVIRSNNNITNLLFWLLKLVLHFRVVFLKYHFLWHWKHFKFLFLDLDFLFFFPFQPLFFLIFLLMSVPHHLLSQVSLSFLLNLRLFWHYAFSKIVCHTVMHQQNVHKEDGSEDNRMIVLSLSSNFILICSKSKMILLKALIWAANELPYSIWRVYNIFFVLNLIVRDFGVSIFLFLPKTSSCSLIPHLSYDFITKT